MFLRDFCEENGLKEKPVDSEVHERLRNKAWPGNVRELKNVVERMAILSDDRITTSDLPAEGKLAQAASAQQESDEAAVGHGSVETFA